jgi:hypothetical protein
MILDFWIYTSTSLEKFYFSTFSRASLPLLGIPPRTLFLTLKVEIVETTF